MIPFFPHPQQHQQQQPKELPWSTPFPGRDLFIGAPFPYPPPQPPLQHWDPRNEPYLQQNGPYGQSVLPYPHSALSMYQLYPQVRNEGFGANMGPNGMFPWPMWFPFETPHELGVSTEANLHLGRHPEMPRTEDFGREGERPAGSVRNADERDERIEENGHRQDIQATEPCGIKIESRSERNCHSIRQENDSSSQFAPEKHDSGCLEHRMHSPAPYRSESRSDRTASQTSQRREEDPRPALRGEQGLPSPPYSGEPRNDRNRLSTPKARSRYEEDYRRRDHGFSALYGGECLTDQNRSGAFPRQDGESNFFLIAEPKSNVPYGDDYRTDRSRTSTSTSQNFYRREEDFRRSSNWERKSSIPYGESRIEQSRRSTSPTYDKANRTLKSEQDSHLPPVNDSQADRKRSSTSWASSRHQRDSKCIFEREDESNSLQRNEYRSDQPNQNCPSHHREDSRYTLSGERGSNAPQRSEYRGYQTDRNRTSTPQMSSLYQNEIWRTEGERGSNAQHGNDDRNCSTKSQASSRYSTYSSKTTSNGREGNHYSTSHNVSRHDDLRNSYKYEHNDDPRQVPYGAETRGDRNRDSGSRTFSQHEGHVSKENWSNSPKREERYSYPENYNQRQEYPPYRDYQGASTHQEYRSVDYDSHYNEISNYASDNHEVYSNPPHSPHWRKRRERKIQNRSLYPSDHAPRNTRWNTEPRKPTEEYLTQASLEPRGTVQPQKILCILDLNGTLIHRDKARADWYPRPGCTELLNYLFKNFHVMVWSSATKANVRSMVRTVFSEDQSRQLVAVWDRSSFNLPPELYKQKTLTLKDLQMVWDGLANSNLDKWELPTYNDRMLRDWDQANTILIDDSIAKAALQPHNCVILKEFNQESVLVGGDRELESVQNYLEKVRWQKDVSAYMRRHPYRSGAGPEIPHGKAVLDFFTLPISDSSSNNRRVEL